MGRPIKKRFFNGAGGTGASGGESVASLRCLEYQLALC